MIFNPLFPVAIVLFASIGLALLFIWFEWRKNSRYFLFRCLAQCMVIASLAALILKPSYKKEHESAGIILLTPGFIREQADSVAGLYPFLQIKRMNGTGSYKNAGLIFSDRNISEYLHDIRFVLGNGISVTAFDRTTKTNFSFLPGIQPRGITDLYTGQIPVVNHPATLRGVVQGSKKSKIVLRSPPGGNEDSTVIASSYAAFNLKFIPKQSGKFIYHIDLKDSTGKVSETQPLPVQILPEKALRILIIQDFPTAEIRFLKNYLSDRHHQITLRYQLSRNVYRYEYANAKQEKIARLETGRLNSFDLMIIDSDALQKLSIMERTQLGEAIRQGLGTIIMLNGLPGKNRVLKEFTNLSFLPSKNDTTHADLSGRKNITLQTLGGSIDADAGVQSTLTANDGKIFSGFTSHGAGHVGFQMITETYKFLTEGSSDVYSALWSELLEKTSRIQQRPFRIRILSPEPIYANEPVDLEITSASDAPTLVTDSIGIPLTEDVLIDNRWLGRMWFNQTGWNTLTVQQDSTTASLYVHDRDSWKSLRISTQQRENLNRQNPSESRRNEMLQGYQEPVPSWIFFAAFLSAAGFLWVAPKL